MLEPFSFASLHSLEGKARKAMVHRCVQTCKHMYDFSQEFGSIGK